MTKQLISLSPLQKIQHEIEEGSKNGKRYFPLNKWEHEFDLDHSRIVSMVYGVEQKRIDGGKRFFIKHESINEKGHSCLSAIEIAEDDKIGIAKMNGERIKRQRGVESKINNYNRALEAAEKDMKKIKVHFEGKHILYSDSGKKLLKEHREAA
jgi:hypothetical protein